jgi:hypothetical protein
MNENIRKVYVKFHTDRRLKLEALTEQRRIMLIEDGRQNSPHTTREALYWAMGQTTEEDELNVFAEMIIKECAEIASDYDNTNYVGPAIELHFGVEL